MPGWRIVGPVIFFFLAKLTSAIMTDIFQSLCNTWDKVFKSGPRKICGRQPLRNLKGYDLLKQIYFTPFSSVCVVNSEQINVFWVVFGGFVRSKPEPYLK